jgi:2TM family of unknown function (DUF5676)
MKVKVPAFGLAVGFVVSAAFTICSLFVAVAPEATAEFIGYLLHIDIAGLTRPISWVSYFAGVLGLGIWTGLWAAAAAKLYNLLLIK